MSRPSDHIDAGRDGFEARDRPTRGPRPGAGRGASALAGGARTVWRQFTSMRVALLLLLLLLFALTGTAFAENALPRPNTVTMIDLGAKSCIPCKMMAPILEKLEAEYRGKADVVFIDVWQNPDEGKKYGISAIPTQIFYDTTGQEIFRHEGYWSKEAILARFQELGVDLDVAPGPAGDNQTA